MKDLTKKVKRSTKKEKKNSLKDAYKERLGDIKKRLEFDKDCLTPSKTGHYGSQASKFTVYGGSAFREAWDEAVIYGTEDEFWEEEEKELQRLNDFQNQQRSSEMSSSDSQKAYLQGCEEFEDSLFHIIRPQSRERKSYRYRENHRRSPTKNKVTPPVVDLVENGRDIVDGILCIGPDDLLCSRSEKSIKSSTKSKSSIISKRDTLSLEKCESSSQVNPNDLNLRSPSKQTQTNYTSIVEIQANPEDISDTSYPFSDTKKCYDNILENTGKEMHSFTQSLEDLDEAIYLHALARKYHHEKQKTNDHLRINFDKYAPDVSVKRESERKHQKHKSSTHAAESKRHISDLNANALESDFKKEKLSKRYLQDVMTDQSVKSQSTNQLRPSTCLTESIELDVRNYATKQSTVEDVRKRFAHVTYSDQLPKTFKLVKNSVSEINDHTPKTKPHHSDLFITSLDKESKQRHTRERQDSLKVSGGSRDSRASHGSSSSRHSEETIFNVTTDFSDKSLKQSNLYLGESPRNGSCDLQGMFNLEFPHVKDHRSNCQSSSIDYAGPMSIKELDATDDDTLADNKIRNSQKSYQKIKKIRQHFEFNIVPKLDLHELSKDYPDHCDSDFESRNADSSQRLGNCLDSTCDTVKLVKPSSRCVSRSKRLSENFNESDNNRSSCETSNLLQDVRDLRYSINESGPTLNFDPEQALLDAGNCVSLNLSRIENCSWIGPWEVGQHSSRDVEKLSIKKQHQTQSHSSPSQQSKAEKKLSQHSAPTKYDSKMSEYSLRNQQRVKRTKTGTDMNFVGLKAMHQDINNRLNQSENVVHMVDMECSHKANCNSYSKLIDKSVVARDATNSKDSQVTRSRKNKMEKPKPIHVQSLQIKQSKINSKVDENAKPHSVSDLVTSHKEKCYVYKSALIKLNRTDLKMPDKMQMAINNLSYSSPNPPVSTHTRTRNLSMTDNKSLNFEERGKKLDEICGILSQSLERKQKLSQPEQTKTEYNTDCCTHRLSDQRRHCPALEQHVDHLKNISSGKKVTQSPKPVDIKFGIDQEKRSVKQTYHVPDAEPNFGKQYNKGAKSDLFRNDIENFKEFLSDLENEPHFDDLNFNSSENLRKSTVSFQHKIQNSKKPETSVAVKKSNEDEAWLSKALKDKYDDHCERISMEHDQSSTMLTGEEDHQSKTSEDEMALTMSDLYTPVTQLISEEYDDSSSEKSTTIQQSDLPLKAVYQNLINHRKSKRLNDLSEESRKRSRNEDISRRTSTNSICYNSRETPTRDCNTSPNKKPSKEISSVDIILSHLDNENSVRLLQKLYTADDATRQQLMIKAEYFKRWHRRIKRSQQERIVYGPIRARAIEFHEMTMMKKYWLKWREDSINSINEQLADELYKQHMLKKGLQGFKWAIFRSQHYYDIMKSRTQKMTLKAVFVKWKRRAYQRQFNRLASTFTNWYQYTQEQKKVRVFNSEMKAKLLKKCYTTWIKRYCVKLKENRADQFSRQCLLSKCVSVWKLFTNESRIKNHRNKQAVVLHTYNVEKKYFYKMVANYRKCQLARQFHRHHMLLKCLCLWKEGSEISHHEKQKDLRVSDQHWTQTTITTMFYYWRERLLMVRAVRNSQLTTQRHVFTVWKTLWLEQKAKHENIMMELSALKVSRHFTAWKDHVLNQNSKRDLLSQQLVKVMLQMRLKEWKCFTDYKKQLRMKCELFRKKCNSSKKQECLAIWLEKYLKHLSVQQARQHWSNNCVSKSIEKWKLKCRKTQLKEILIETEPERNLHLIKVMFSKWKTAKCRLDQEIYEADIIREELEKLKLRRMFDVWKKAMEQLNKLQPLIQSRQNLALKRCFQSWNESVQHKLQRVKNYDVIVNLRLQNIFNRWRRQYKVCEIEKDIERNRQRKFSNKCLREWRDVVKRKQSANLFHKQHLQSYLFNYWKSRTSRQIEEKTQRIELEERNFDLKKAYLKLWLDNIKREKTLEEDRILQTHQHRSYRQLTTAFYSWKHHLQITLVARVYSKGLERKHLKEVLNVWKKTTQYSLQDSIHQFSIRLGLPVNYTDRFGSEISTTETQSRNDDTYSLDGDNDCTMIDDSPRSISSINTITSLNRLFTGYPSERSVDIEKLDLDNQSLLSGIESAIIDERESKIQRKQELVSLFINRLRHWPVSVMFDQWKDFMINQRELKEAANQVAEISQMVKLKLAFRRWKCHLKSINKAQAHRDKVVCSTTLNCFKNYHKSRCVKRKMADSANKHHMKTELQKYFPVWIEKAKEKQHKENILRLWSTATPEEMELLPLEQQFSTNLNKRTLHLCFSIWQTKYLFVQKIRHVQNSFILKRVITEWNDWARDNHERNTKCEQFRRKHIQSRFLKQWGLKLQQKQATEEKYEKAWQSYLAVILRRWHQWAKGNHQNQVLSKQLTTYCQHNKLQQTFYNWRDLTIKATQVRQNHNRLVALVALRGWREVLEEKKQERKTVLQFQVKCYTNLVKVLFGKWRKEYFNRLNDQQEKQKHVELKALEIGKKWRKTARKSRAVQHYKLLQSRRLCEFFAKWRSKYTMVLNLEEVLESHIEVKNQELVSQMLLHWKNRLLLNHVDQVYQTKLQITVFQEWIMWAKAKKERRIRGLALQRALQERTQHVYFKLWLGYTKLNQTVKKHFNVKLQIRSLEAWHVYTQKKKILDANSSIMAARVRHNRLLKTFTFLRNRFDYCQALQETAQKIHDDQNKAIQRHSLLLWHDKLDRIMSARCYGKFLAWRVARQWRNFVCRKQAERQKEAEQEEMAIKHYNKHLCKMALNVMKRERCITTQIEKRKDRIVKQYARLWKWKVDLSYTAKLVDSERMIKKFWRKWRIEYRRKQTVDKVTSFHQNQLLSQVFLSWKSLGNKKRRKSSLPLPVTIGDMESPGYGSPYFHGNQQCGDSTSIVNSVILSPDGTQAKPTINGGYKVSNGLTKSNIRKIITRSDKFRSKIPSPSTK